VIIQGMSVEAAAFHAELKDLMQGLTGRPPDPKRSTEALDVLVLWCGTMAVSLGIPKAALLEAIASQFDAVHAHAQQMTVVPLPEPGK